MLALHENALLTALREHRDVKRLVRTLDTLPRLIGDKLLAKYFTDAPALYIVPGRFTVKDDEAVMEFTVAGVIRNVAGHAQARKGDGIDLGCDHLMTLATRALNRQVLGQCSWTLVSGEMADDEVFDIAGISAIEMRFVSSPVALDADYGEAQLDELADFEYIDGAVPEHDAELPDQDNIQFETIVNGVRTGGELIEISYVGEAIPPGAAPPAPPPAAPPPPPPPVYKIHLPLSGTNNSTSYSDSGTLDLIWSGWGNAKISTAVLPGGALLLDGTGDYISAPYPNDALTGDFNISFEFLKTQDGQNGSDMVAATDFSGSAFNGWFLELSSSRGLFFYRDGLGVLLQYAFNPNDGLLHSCELKRVAGVISFVLDGAIVASANKPQSITTTSSVIQVGKCHIYTFQGIISNFRLDY